MTNMCVLKKTSPIIRTDIVILHTTYYIHSRQERKKSNNNKPRISIHFMNKVRLLFTRKLSFQKDFSRWCKVKSCGIK